MIYSFKISSIQNSTLSFCIFSFLTSAFKKIDQFFRYVDTLHPLPPLLVDTHYITRRLFNRQCATYLLTDRNRSDSMKSNSDRTYRAVRGPNLMLLNRLGPSLHYIVLRGFKEALNFSPIMPGDASLSDSE